jgi:PAS domain S-box-containing protein
VTVATSLRGLAADATVVWTPRLDRATTWIEQHPDVAALIAEAPVDQEYWPTVVEHLRRLTSHPAVVCITPDDAAPRFDPPEPSPDEIIARNPSWLGDLPDAVQRAIGRAHARQHTAPTPNLVGTTDPRVEATAERAALERQAELQALLEQERAARADLEQRLAAATSALDEADARHRTAAATAAEQLARVQHQHEISALRAAATREMLDEQLRGAVIEVERARQEHASAAAQVDQLSRRESELSTLIAEAAAGRLTLEQRVADDADRFAERQRDLEARIAEEVDRRNRSEASLAQSRADIERLTERGADLTARVADLEADRASLARQIADARRALENGAGREQELEGRIADERAARATLEQTLTDAGAAFRGAQEQHEAALAASNRELAERQAQFDRELKALEGRIENERAARATLEQTLTDAQAAHRIAQERHEAALAAFASEIAERQAQFDRELTETGASRDTLAERLAGAEAALEQLRRDHQVSTAVIERLTRREADLTSQLADVRDARDTLERRLTDAANAIQAANDRAAHDRAVGAERQADLEARLAQAHEETEMLRTQALEQAARLENQLADERRAHEAQMAEMHDWNRRMLLESDALQQSLSEVQHRADRLDVALERTREQLVRVQSTAEADVHRLTTERLEVERALEDAGRGFQGALECLSNEHDTAVAALAVAVGERDAQLRDEEARFVASQQAAEALRKELQDHSQAALTLRDRAIEQLQGTLKAARQTLEEARRRQDILQAEANQVPTLRRQLHDSRAETDRLFQQAPLAMFRCTKDGAVTLANRAWASLLYRNVDDLGGAGFATTVFESPDDLSALIEQCLSTNANESIETTVRRKDGARLFVRLSASASPAGLIEIAAENLTRVRVLQDRLERAHRMEAVGRLSSEVAMKCTVLLNDVHQKARQWLMAGDGSASRQEGEMLLDDLTRAVGSLQQLVAYGDKKSRIRTVIDLNALVRDLAPVLKQIAGEDVELQLQDASSPLSVNIETERIERLLINLVASARDRMLSGGKLTIDVGAVMVDLRFTARHPNVRPGPHALITVRETRRPPRADGLLLSPDGTIPDRLSAGGGRKMGIELGALQRLVGGCRGHLWMRVQPHGDIVAKVRLPLLTSYDHPQARALAVLGERSRTITRWFQR